MSKCLTPDYGETLYYFVNAMVPHVESYSYSVDPFGIGHNSLKNTAIRPLNQHSPIEQYFIPNCNIFILDQLTLSVLSFLGQALNKHQHFGCQHLMSILSQKSATTCWFFEAGLGPRFRRLAHRGPRRAGRGRLFRGAEPWAPPSGGELPGGAAGGGHWDGHHQLPGQHPGRCRGEFEQRCLWCDSGCYV